MIVGNCIINNFEDFKQYVEQGKIDSLTPPEFMELFATCIKPYQDAINELSEQIERRL